MVRFAVSKPDLLIPSGSLRSTPPLTIRGGIFYYGSLVQRELSAQLTEGLSVYGSICCIETRSSYPLRLAPLDTSPYHKGRLGEGRGGEGSATHSPVIGRDLGRLCRPHITAPLCKAGKPLRHPPCAKGDAEGGIVCSAPDLLRIAVVSALPLRFF